MNSKELSQMEERIEALHGRTDALIEKLGTAAQLLAGIQQKFDDLPNGGDVSEFAEACGSIRQNLAKAATSWEELPELSTLNEYAESASAIANGLQPRD